MNPEQLEYELRTALRRAPAPSGFSGKVMASIPRRPRLLPWALAAGLAIGVLSPSLVSEHRRVKAEQAKHDLIAALNITRAKIRQTREIIQRRAGRI